jgi:excisionase family DNA binding protein
MPLVNDAGTRFNPLVTAASQTLSARAGAIEDHVSSASHTEYLSTSQVAESLGVSVSTVKRWVEEEILPAQKTAGGHRKLLLTDVLDLARRNNLPLPAAGFHKRGKRSRTAAAADQADALYRSLVSGDALEVRRIIRNAYGGGIAVETLADEIIAPSMQRIGSDWETGKIDVLHEHRATQLCLDVLHELKSALENRARRARLLAVGGAIESDFSELPTLLAQMVLLQAGWDAINLGPNTPITSFRRALVELRPRLIWISFSHAVIDTVLRSDYRAFYERAEEQRVPVMIGGRALTEPLRSSLPYTAYGDGLANLASFARTLHRQPNRPKRGRPRHDTGGKSRVG